MDRHECGTCGEEFSQIEEFVTHKKSGCQESEYSPPNVDTLGSKRNTTEETVTNPRRTIYKDSGGVVRKFRQFLVTKSEFDLDHMVEKAKNGEKADIENTLQNFVRQYRTTAKGNKRYSGTRPLQPNTQMVYINILKTWIYEYSGGLVDLKSKPWGNCPRVSNSNPSKVTAAANEHEDQDGYTLNGAKKYEQDFSKSLPNVDTLGPTRNAAKEAMMTPKRAMYKDSGRIVGLFKDFLNLKSKLDLDQMVEKAKNGEKDDLEKTMQIFVGNYRARAKGNRKNTNTRPLKLHTKQSYLNALTNWIYEYSGGLVDLKDKHWGNYPKVSSSNILKVTAVASPNENEHQDQGGYSSTRVEMEEHDFPKRCQYCPPFEAAVFLTEPSLRAHWQESHPYQCPNCQNKTSNRADLRNHFLKEHPINKVYFCNNCTGTFTSVEEMKNHGCKNNLQGGAAMLLKVKPWYPSKCPFCPLSSKEVYQTLVSYEYHSLSMHAEQCPLCPEAFRYLGNKRNHFRSSHSNVGPHFCSKCPSVYVSSEMADQHKCSSTPMVVDFRDPPWWDGCLFSCKRCGEGFPEVRDVRSHVYYEHITQNEREGLQKPLYGIVKKDYLELKTTYWKCQLCVKYGNKSRTKNILKRRYSSIISHLKLGHQNMSIQMYEQAILNPQNEVDVPKQKMCLWSSKDSEEQMVPSQKIQDSSTDMKPDVKKGSGDYFEENTNEKSKDGSPWIISEKNITEAIREGIPWWDGCSYQCKHCDGTFSETGEVRKHLWKKHESVKQHLRMKDLTTPFKNECGMINLDYELIKVTYWRCTLCNVDTKQAPGNGVIQRKYSTIQAHLQGRHSISFEEYQEIIKKPWILKEELEKAQRQKRKLRKSYRSNCDFRQKAAGKLKCKICRKRIAKSVENHVLEFHNITSLQEYEKVVMYLPNESSQEEFIADAGSGPPRFQHLRSPQSGQCMRWCKICEKEFCNQQYFNIHMKKAHGIDNTIDSYDSLGYQNTFKEESQKQIKKLFSTKVENEHGNTQIAEVKSEHKVTNFNQWDMEGSNVDPLGNIESIVKEEMMLPDYPEDNMENFMS